MACDRCIHDPNLKDMYEPVSNADYIRAMSDEKLAGYLAKMLADYTAGLYDGSYVQSDEVTRGIAEELLQQLQQPYESPTGQKG